MHRALPEVDTIDRALLKDSTGRSFKDLRHELTPRWKRVWADIAAGYMVIIASIIALAYLDSSFPAVLIPLWTVLGALVLGYAIAFIQLFLHEAAHFNVAPRRKLNDRLANIFIGLMVGQDIKAYRTVHFHHHRYLGTPLDTERSYFDSLDLRFIVEGLVGVKLLTVLSRRATFVEADKPTTSLERPDGVQRDTRRRLTTDRNRRLAMLAGGVTLNLAIVVVAIATSHWALAIAWPIGMASVHPLINATRQLLEHRGFDARPEVDYSTTQHGPVTRMFGHGPVSSTLGGAGFNRHLLHHWEPQISYTRFAALEAFLLDTSSGPVFRAQTTTYAQAFARLLRAA